MIIDLGPVLAAAKKVNKVWGRETWVTNTELYCAKILELNPGWMCSFHKHVQKDEEFHVLAGTVELETMVEDVNGNRAAIDILKAGNKFRIRPGMYHRFGSKDGATILEISTTHSDEDVVRLEESRQIPE